MFDCTRGLSVLRMVLSRELTALSEEKTLRPTPATIMAEILIGTLPSLIDDVSPDNASCRCQYFLVFGSEHR